MDDALPATGHPKAHAGGNARTRPPFSGKSISRVAVQLGVTTRAIRWYESAGILQVSRHGKQRVFTERDICVLALVTRDLRLGFSLAEIRTWLTRRSHDGCPGTPTEGTAVDERRQRLLSLRADVDAALHEMEEEPGK